MHKRMIDLEVKIKKMESDQKRRITRLNRVQVWYSIVQYVVLPAASVFVFALLGCSYFLYSVALFAAASILKNIVIFFLRIMIESTERKIGRYKEMQMKEVRRWVEKDEYKVAMDLIDDFESEASRNVADLEDKIHNRTGLIERVIDLIVGGNPSSTMYALICEKCFTHNGLVHSDRYAKSRFVCTNCLSLNVAGEEGEDKKIASVD